MASAIMVSVGWTHPETEDEFTVRCRVNFGTPRPMAFGPRSTWVPGDDEATVEIRSVTLDEPKGFSPSDVAARELAAAALIDVDEDFRVRATEEAADRDASAREDADEARAEAIREDRRLGL